MKIEKEAIAGSLESNDVLITLQPNARGIELEIDSVVKQQFGDAIEALIREVLAEHGIEDAYLRVNDRGAIDCTMRARVETAIARSQRGGRTK